MNGLLLASTAPLPDSRSIVLVFAASALAVILSRLSRGLVLPTVVVEIVLGILIGPQVLGIAKADAYLQFLSTFGLAMLFFFAGLEVVLKQVPRDELVRGAFGWGISLALGVTAGLLLQTGGLDARWWLLAVALSTTSLGTLVPILSDSGILPTPLGSAVLGTGVAGEFWPIVVISVFLTGAYGALGEILLLIGFTALVGALATAALRVRPPRLIRTLQETLHTTGQAAVRLALLVLASLVYLATKVGFDFVLGAFAAGLVVGLVLKTPEGSVVQLRLEGIGFGFLIPIYFVVTGMNFDLDSLLTRNGLVLAAVFLTLLLVVRGASSLLWLRRLGRRSTSSLALFGATGLPLIVAIVGIGMDRGAIGTQASASLIGAGMISVLVFPLAGVRTAPGTTEREPPTTAAATEY